MWEHTARGNNTSSQIGFATVSGLKSKGLFLLIPVLISNRVWRLMEGESEILWFKRGDWLTESTFNPSRFPIGGGN